MPTPWGWQSQVLERTWVLDDIMEPLNSSALEFLLLDGFSLWFRPVKSELNTFFVSEGSLDDILLHGLVNVSCPHLPFWKIGRLSARNTVGGKFSSSFQTLEFRSPVHFRQEHSEKPREGVLRETRGSIGTRREERRPWRLKPLLCPGRFRGWPCSSGWITRALITSVFLPAKGG